MKREELQTEIKQTAQKISDLETMNRLLRIARFNIIETIKKNRIEIEELELLKSVFEDDLKDLNDKDEDWTSYGK